MRCNGRIWVIAEPKCVQEATRADAVVEALSTLMFDPAGRQYRNSRWSSSADDDFST